MMRVFFIEKTIHHYFLSTVTFVLHLLDTDLEHEKLDIRLPNFELSEVASIGQSKALRILM